VSRGLGELYERCSTGWQPSPVRLVDIADRRADRELESSACLGRSDHAMVFGCPKGGVHGFDEARLAA
jgi:hypothetical protein